MDGGINAYLATPSEENAHKSVGVLFIPEVIGIDANSQLLADGFAAKGYTTLIPDVFNGDAIPLNKFPNVDLLSWVAKGFDGLWIGKPDLSALSGVSPYEYRDGHLRPSY
ncbi:hypothetical protein HDV62DRAFT_398752 [Trichoderma sp. SZMC 28011]